MEDYKDTIIDSSVPNAGRIYDYLIGGHHHFEVDRIAAQKVVEIVPIMPKLLKLIRMFLQESIDRCVQRGFKQFIDFASGLPTDDHIHNNTPEGTKVVYSDIDPVTVRYGQKLIGDNPNVKFEKCDAGTPEILLQSETVKNLFKNNHKAAIGFTGICWFLTNDQISHAMKTLYEWADKGSVVFTSDIDTEHISDMWKKGMEVYKNMKQPAYLRSKEHFIELIKPWRVEEPGFLPFEEWINLKANVTEDSFKDLGGGNYGGFLIK